MKVTCKRCGWSKIVTKSQAYDLARFEGCQESGCGGNLPISGVDA